MRADWLVDVAQGYRGVEGKGEEGRKIGGDTG